MSIVSLLEFIQSDQAVFCVCLNSVIWSWLLFQNSIIFYVKLLANRVFLHNVLLTLVNYILKWHLICF